MRNLGEMIRSDAYRYMGREGLLSVVKCYFSHIGFKYTFWYRLASYTYANKSVLYYLPRFIHKRMTVKYGIEIPPDTVIGFGFYIGHFGGIVISSDAVIGSNVNISHGVTIGAVSRGHRKGFPTIGDRVYIGPGAKIIGFVSVSNDSAIGANAVVTRNTMEKDVVVGIPGKTISKKGSEGYCINVW